MYWAPRGRPKLVTLVAALVVNAVLGVGRVAHVRSYSLDFVAEQYVNVDSVAALDW